MQYYELPSASPLDDINAWIPLLLTAVDAELNTPSAFPDDWHIAQGKIGDLIARISEGFDMIPIGTLNAFAGTSTPPKWLFCDGAAISRTTYATLFSIIGTTWGAGDGATTFNVPDLRGRAVVGAGEGVGLTTRSLGQSGGNETHTLTIAQMPAHSHRFHPSTNVSLIRPISGGTISFATGTLQGEQYTTTQTTGDGAPHNNMQPFAVLNWIIYAGA